MHSDKKLFICEPEKNASCNKSTCYIYGGDCCLTYNQEFESPYFSKEMIKKARRFSYGNFLPRVLREIRSQKLQSL